MNHFILSKTFPLSLKKKLSSWISCSERLTYTKSMHLSPLDKLWMSQGPKIKFTYCSQTPAAQRNWLCQELQSNWQFPVDCSWRTGICSHHWTSLEDLTGPVLFLPCQQGMKGNQLWSSSTPSRLVIWNLSKGLHRTLCSYVVWVGRKTRWRLTKPLLQMCTSSWSPTGAYNSGLLPSLLIEAAAHTVVASEGCCPFPPSLEVLTVKYCSRYEHAVLADKISLDAVLEFLRSPWLYYSQH